MHFKSFFSFMLACIVLTVCVVVVFGFLSWLQVPTGRFLDWVVSLVSFWWLLVIVTVPWNIHFRAKEVLVEAAKSQDKEIPVNQADVIYVQTLSQRSFVVAIALHGISALGLYILAATGISAVGYIGAVAALLLTGLRPAIRLYEYLAARLAGISREFQYPRENVQELRQRVDTLEAQVKALQKELDPEEPASFAATQHKLMHALQDDLSRTRIALETLQVSNQAEHDRLAHEAQHALAQITQDGQFLDHVREIIRFFKAA